MRHGEFLEWADALEPRRIVLWGLALALAFEVVTVILRFGLGLQSTGDTGFLARFTFGLRIHHGYLGVLLALGALLFASPGALKNLALVVAIGLVVSDIAHHFLVLWPITGSPEFDFFYPKPHDR